MEKFGAIYFARIASPTKCRSSMKLTNYPKNKYLITCPRCSGADVYPGLRVCQLCRDKLNADSYTPPPPPKKSCVFCGSCNLHEVNLTGYTDLICGDCGATLKEDIHNNQTYENQLEPKP